MIAYTHIYIYIHRHGLRHHTISQIQSIKVEFSFLSNKSLDLIVNPHYQFDRIQCHNGKNPSRCIYEGISRGVSIKKKEEEEAT